MHILSNRISPATILIMTILTALSFSHLAGETVVEIAPGTYEIDDIVNASGSSSDWIRYRPEEPETVIVRGGELKDVEYVILDGFFFDGKLDPRFPVRSFGLLIEGSNIVVENCHFAGPHDIHTGFNAENERDCSEGNGAVTWSIGITINDDSKNVILRNILVHGFYRGLSFRFGTEVILRDSMIRNNFNAIGINSDYAELRGNVFWVNPNHGLTSNGGGTIYVIDNLIVDAQEMFWVWERGVERLLFVHNTFHLPEEKPCYGFEGIHSEGVTKQLLVRDNIFVNEEDPWVGVEAGLEGLNFTSDYNLYYHYDKASKDEFWIHDRDPHEVTLSEWRSLTGQDENSRIAKPVFSNAPEYGGLGADEWGFFIPSSVAEARGWYSLEPGSPGENENSDGRAMGIYPRTSFNQGPEPPRNLRLTNETP